MKKLTADNFEEQVTNVKGMILVDFWAEWCGPCKVMLPLLQKLEDDYNIEIYKIDVDKEVDLAMKYQIRSIPTILKFVDGEVVDAIYGSVAYNKLKGLIDK